MDGPCTAPNGATNIWHLVPHGLRRGLQIWRRSAAISLMRTINGGGTIWQVTYLAWRLTMSRVVRKKRIDPLLRGGKCID